MSQLAAVLKTEIARLARKQIKVDLLALQRTASAMKADVAQLRKRVIVLEKAAGRLVRERSRSPAQRIQEAEDAPVQRRFSATRLAAHRKKLGLSAAAYAQLLGVSALTVYKWESGTTRPRASQLEAIAQVRALGKREAAAQLEQAGV